MKLRIFLIYSLLFTLNIAPGQVTYDVDTYQTPAPGGMTYNQTNIFQDFFEPLNVGNLHVFSTTQQPADESYFFKGNLIDQSWYQYFDIQWKQSQPKRFKAYACYAITISDNQYFIIRTTGKKNFNSIDLFALNQGVITHRQTLAYHIHEGGIKSQLDSWIQDFDLDTKKDIFKKLSVHYDWSSVHELYTTTLKQFSGGTFKESQNLSVDKADFIMHKIP